MRGILCLSLTLFLSACGTAAINPMARINPTLQMQTRAMSPSRAVTTITVKEANEWLADPNSSWQLLDIRTPEEFATGHLKDATLMNFYDKDFRDRLLNMNRHQPTIIYCRSGNRSGKALEMMRELGFRNVYDIQGGTLAWQAAGLPLVK